MESRNIAHVASKEQMALNSKESFHAAVSWRDLLTTKENHKFVRHVIDHPSLSIDALCADIRTSKVEFGVIAIEDINGILNSSVNGVIRHCGTIKVVDEIVLKDGKDEDTRYWILGHDEFEKVTHNKTCVLLNHVNRGVGYLSKALATFSANEIGLIVITSIPVQGHKGEYMFMIELETHSTDANFEKALDTLEFDPDIGVKATVLGSYENHLRKIP